MAEAYWRLEILAHLAIALKEMPFWENFGLRTRLKTRSGAFFLVGLLRLLRFDLLEMESFGNLILITVSSCRYSFYLMRWNCLASFSGAFLVNKGCGAKNSQNR